MTTDRSAPRVPVHARRADIVSRLLERGLTRRLLTLLLPEWRPLIDRVAAERIAQLELVARDDDEDHDEDRASA